MTTNKTPEPTESYQLPVPDAPLPNFLLAEPKAAAPTKAVLVSGGLPRSVLTAGSIILLAALVGLFLMIFGKQLDLSVDSGIAGMTLGVLAGLAAAVILIIDRYQAQLERERSLMVETLDEAVVGRAICDATGKAFFVNAAFWRQLEPLAPEMADPLQPEAILASLFAQLPGKAEEFARVCAAAHGGAYGASELVMTGPSGLKHCLLVEGWPSKSHKGHVTWCLEDITPRVQVQEAIQREQAKWADFMDHAPVGFFSVDENGRFVFANATLARWLGTAPVALVAGGMTLHGIMPKRQENGAPYDLGGENGVFQQGEFVLRGPGGREFQALIAQTVDVADGKVRTRAVVHDLTPERDWQTALQQSQARFRRFFEESPIGIALVAEGELLAECNPAFVRMLGADATVLLSQPLSRFVEGQNVDLSQRLARVMTGEGPNSPIEVKLKGVERELSAQLYARRLAGDDVTGARLILHFIDLTEQKSLEARFAQSQKMQAIGQLAGGVAHDFNNLLTAMGGFCDLLLLRHKPGDPSFGDIKQIQQNANRAAGLVRQLLAFSRQQTLQPKVLSMTDVLVELSNLLRRLIGENIQLGLVHGRDIGLIKADQGQIEQVIINMAVNARDAMPSGGKLTITTSNMKLAAPLRREAEEVAAGEWVVVEVSDTGTGIPPDIMSRIFDPFFSTKEVGKGTGLGLSTCFGIVKQSGGHVFVDSEVGRGTTFSVYLPRYTRTDAEVQAVQQEQAAEVAPPDLTGAGTILLVEDEDAVRMFAARALKNKGYNVVEAHSGDHALEVLKDYKGKLDLVVSDVMMPGIDGPTLMKSVKQQLPGIKAIFISGYSEDRLRETFETDEQVHFLPKPFSLKQLAEKVKDVLKG